MASGDVIVVVSNLEADESSEPPKQLTSEDTGEAKESEAAAEVITLSSGKEEVPTSQPEALNPSEATDPLTITEVVPDVSIQDVVETVIEEAPPISEASGSQMVLNSNTAAVIQTIIDALTAAAAEANSEEAELQKEAGTSSENEADTSTDNPKSLADDPNSATDAAAALQALASQASGMSATDAIAHLQQMLQVSPNVVSSLVNEVASEVIIMAQAVQNATQAVESLIDDEDSGEDLSEIKKTKGGVLKIHKCPECYKGFSLRSTLTKHLQRHTHETKCAQCDKIFFSQVKLATHIRTHHTPSEKVRDVLCPECGKGFYNHAKLRVHMRGHTGERPYPCAFCEKRFICTSHRKRHERLHTGEHPFVCDTCGKGFGSPSNLKDHTYTHTKENPYPCNICGKGFTQWGAMMRHIAAIHEKRKDVKCPLCNKCFSRKDYLKLHIQKCHWNKCPNCKETFETDEIFEVHKIQCSLSPGTSTRSTPRTPTKRRATVSPRKAATSPRKSQQQQQQSGSPQIKVVLTPARKKARKSPVVPPINRRKRTNPSHINQLMSIYDQFDDDPLADPEYEEEAAMEEGEEEVEEIVEEEGVGVDQEEILVQEEVKVTGVTEQGEGEGTREEDGGTTDGEQEETQQEPQPDLGVVSSATLESLVNALVHASRQEMSKEE